MAVTSITIFGTNYNGVHSFDENTTSLCKKHGVDYDGPISLPTVHRTHVIEYFGLEHHTHSIHDEIPDWFQEIGLSVDERETIISTVDRDPEDYGFNLVFGKKIRVKHDETAATILSHDTEDGVFLRVSIENEDIPKSTSNIPYSYDPNQDHVTDL